MGDEAQIHSTTINCSVCLLCNVKANFCCCLLEQEDPIQGLLDDWTFHSSIPLLTRMTNCLCSILFPEFSVCMIIVLCGQPSRKTAWLQLVTSPFIDQLSLINNLTAPRHGRGRTKTFWETPRKVSLAEKNTGPSHLALVLGQCWGFASGTRDCTDWGGLACHVGPPKSQGSHGLPRGAQVLFGISEGTNTCFLSLDLCTDPLGQLWI